MTEAAPIQSAPTQTASIQPASLQTAPIQPIAILIGGRLDLETELLRQWVTAAIPNTVVHLLPDLFTSPDLVGKALHGSGATGCVFGLGAGDFPAAEVQAQVRRAGLDSLGIEVVHLAALPRGQAMEQAKLLLAAAAARARAFPGSTAENARPYMSALISRRSLLQLALREYRPVPSVDPVRCASIKGCKLCIEICPYNAIRAASGRAEVEVTQCGHCGQCVTACPREAIADPSVGPAQVEAEIRTLLNPGIGGPWPRGILFTCRHGGLADPGPNMGDLIDQGWLLVKVPCIDMLPVGWLLAPLAMGAAAVGVIPAGGSASHGRKVAPKVAYCRELLTQLGANADRVQLAPDLGPIPLQDEQQGNFATQMDDILDRISFGYLGAAQAITALARAYGRGAEVAFEHPDSPIGIVQIQSDFCTGCGVCAAVCSTGALSLDQSPESRLLSLDPKCCTACGECLGACPEQGRGAIRVVRRTDLALVARGREPVYSSEIVRCASCQAPVAAGGMIRRVRAMLSQDKSGEVTASPVYCSSCRGGGIMGRFGYQG